MAAASTVHDFHDTDYFQLLYIFGTFNRHVIASLPINLEPPMDYICIRLLLAFL